MSALMQPGPTLAAIVVIVIALALIGWLGARRPDWTAGPELVTQRPGHDGQTGQWSRDNLRPVAWPEVDPDLVLVRIRRANAWRGARSMVIGVPAW